MPHMVPTGASAYPPRSSPLVRAVRTRKTARVAKRKNLSIVAGNLERNGGYLYVYAYWYRHTSRPPPVLRFGAQLSSLRR